MWDLLGYDSSFRSMNRTFCRDANGAIVVADSMNEASIYNTINWKQNVNEILSQQLHTASMINGQSTTEKDEPQIPMLLVLNKLDLVEEHMEQGYKLEEYMTSEFIEKFVEENGFIGCVSTSAKTGVGVTEAMGCLIRRIL